MKNLELYNRVRSVPKEAQKEFDNGRFRGTDINAMWRIKVLTEEFGICGIGWYFEIVKQWTTEAANGEICAFTEIKLYIKSGNEWSKPIAGIGGSMLINNFKTGQKTNDECFKMATTDAIGVACKHLGVGADIYWAQDRSKYTDDEPKPPKPQKVTNEPKPPKELIKLASEGQKKAIKELVSDISIMLNYYNSKGGNFQSIDDLPADLAEQIINSKTGGTVNV